MSYQLVIFTIIRLAYKGCRGHDHMAIVTTSTYAIGAYHHLSCKLESHTGVLETKLCDKACQ